VANKLVGIINLNVTNRLRPFTLGQMKALTILASTAAAALESASLYTQLQQAEEKYRSIFENAVEGIFQSTPEGRFITVNPSMARILGYESPDEMIALRLLKYRKSAGCCTVSSLRLTARVAKRSGCP
jgi:PAS domain-containing protein